MAKLGRFSGLLPALSCQNPVRAACSPQAPRFARTGPEAWPGSFLQDGLTPLHCAARSGHDPAVELLLERGAPLLARTKVSVRGRPLRQSILTPQCLCGEEGHIRLLSCLKFTHTRKMRKPAALSVLCLPFLLPVETGALPRCQ